MTEAIIAPAAVQTGPPDGYLPIAEHGIIGDLHTIALVGTDGSIDWYCPNRFDAPSVFGAILDCKKGGYWRVAPAVEGAQAKQLYMPDTNVLITRYLSPQGVAEVIDFMPIGQPGRLVRRVLGIKGEMPMRVEVEPRFDYARASHETTLDDRGAVFASPDLTLCLNSATAKLEPTEQGVVGSFVVRPEESVSFILGPERCDLDEGEVRDLFAETVEFWRRWLHKSRYHGRWREAVHRSALTLKLLTYKPSGAIVAAPTTSLPEQLGGERNWDYRYVWVRDAAFCVYALLRLGLAGQAEAFMRFLTT